MQNEAITYYDTEGQFLNANQELPRTIGLCHVGMYARNPAALA
jgi:hypothetical protein